jgi:hypothetical protein
LYIAHTRQSRGITLYIAHTRQSRGITLYIAHTRQSRGMTLHIAHTRQSRGITLYIAKIVHLALNNNHSLTHLSFTSYLNVIAFYTTILIMNRKFKQ